jgi:hypothetical protein
MKMKNVYLSVAFCLLSIFQAFAQNKIENEILVFFKSGVERESRIEDGETKIRANFKQSSLLDELLKIGLKGETFEAALPKFQQSDTVHLQKDGKRLVQLDMTKLYKYKVPDQVSMEELLKKLNALPEILYAEKNVRVSHLAIPSDTRFNDQWGVRNIANPGADIHAERAWDVVATSFLKIHFT